MRKKDPKKYQQILDAAADLILTTSVAQISTTKIAQQIGLSQSSIYIYFESRDQLLIQLFLREVNRLYQYDREDPPATNTDFAQQLQHYIRHLYAFALAHPVPMTVIQQLSTELALQPQYADTVNAAIQDSPVQRLLLQGSRDHRLRPVDISLIRQTVFATIKRHTDNIRTGRYTANERPLAPVIAMIMAGIMQRDD